MPTTAGNGVVSQGTYDAATGLFDIGILNIGETATLTLEGTVDVGEGGNTITNVTTAAIGDQPDPQQQSVINPIHRRSAINSATGLYTIGTLNEGAVVSIELTGTVDVP